MRTGSCRLVAFAATLALVAGCGGGGSSDSGSPETTEVAMHANAVVVSPTAAGEYAVDVEPAGTSAGALTYAGATPPRAGQVLVLNGSAYRVESVRPVGTGYEVTARTPAIEEVFERLRLRESLDLSLSTLEPVALAKGAGTATKTRRLAGGKVEVEIQEGPITGTLTVDVSGFKVGVSGDWSFSDRRFAVELSPQGEIEVSGSVSVVAGSLAVEKRILLGVYRIPIASSLGLVSLAVPIAVRVVGSAEISIELLRATQVTTFAGSAGYNSATDGWNNAVSVNAGPWVITSPVAETIRTSNQYGQRVFERSTDIASVKIYPEVAAQVEFLRGVAGLAGLSFRLGPKVTATINVIPASEPVCAELVGSASLQFGMFVDRAYQGKVGTSEFFNFVFDADGDAQKFKPLVEITEGLITLPARRCVTTPNMAFRVGMYGGTVLTERAIQKTTSPCTSLSPPGFQFQPQTYILRGTSLSLTTPLFQPTSQASFPWNATVAGFAGPAPTTSTSEISRDYLFAFTQDWASLRISIAVENATCIFNWEVAAGAVPM